MANIYKYMLISEAVISVLLITLILVQGKGAGLSDVFGGGGTSYSTKRGFEKKLHYITIFIATAFLVLGVLLLIFKGK